MKVFAKNGSDVKSDDQDFLKLRQAFLDALATWKGSFLRRSERIQAHLETVGVSDAVLEDTVNEGQAILRYLSAIGRRK